MKLYSKPVTKKMVATAVVLLLAMSSAIAAVEIDKQVKEAVSAVSAEYDRKVNAIKRDLKDGIDEGHIEDFEALINVDIEWGLTSISFDLPSVDMKLQRWVIDLPSTRMVYKSCVMKIPEFYDFYKTRMRCVGMHVPEFFMDRQEFKLHVPEFHMERVKWKFHLPKITSVDSTIKHKQRLGAAFKKRFVDLAEERVAATRDAILAVYDKAIGDLQGRSAQAVAKGADVKQVQVSIELLKAQRAAVLSQMNRQIDRVLKELK